MIGKLTCKDKARSFCIGCKVECGSLFFKEIFLALFETYFSRNYIFKSEYFIFIIFVFIHQFEFVICLKSAILGFQRIILI